MKKSLVVFGLLSLALMTGTASAMPDMGKAAEARFTQMDTDKDGAVSPEEFKKAYPNMQDAAFGALDSNKDGKLSQDEWSNFMRQHAMGKAGHPQAGAVPDGQDAKNPASLPLVTPPTTK